MSETEARAFLEGVSKYGDERAREVALEALAKWDAVSGAARRMRESRARKQPEAKARSDVANATRLRPVTERDVTADVTERNGNATDCANGPSLISRSSNLGGSERGDTALALALTEPVALRSPRAKHRYPETVAPDPNDAPAFLEFCGRWELDGKDPVVIACIGHHYAKGTKWRDWKWAVRNWRSRERSAANGARWVQPTGGKWQPGEAERKAEDIP